MATLRQSKHVAMMCKVYVGLSQFLYNLNIKGTPYLKTPVPPDEYRYSTFRRNTTTSTQQFYIHVNVLHQFLFK
jgi:hypothetical protein